MQDVRSFFTEKGIEFLFCSFVELSGACKAKLVPATHVEEMEKEGAGFAGFAAGDLNQGPHDPDISSMPDFDACIQLPWKKNIAWVPGNLYVNGQPWDYCPRTILQRQVDKLRARGFVMNVGVEPEFMLLKQTDSGPCVPGDDFDTLEKPCYDLRALNRNVDLMTTLLRYMQELGWHPYASDHEDANCQFEINWTYSDAVRTADRHTFFKWMVRTVAEKHGLWATFMPKPFSNLTGNGAHFHLSLADVESGENVFLDTTAEFGLSKMGRSFMAGVLHHGKALSAILAPIVNSYKRLVRGAPRSGATWAPVYITYGSSNRTQMIRIPGPGRFETRMVDGAANPYLACAALLAAGMDGVDRNMEPGDPNYSNLYETSYEEVERRKIVCLPATLMEAIDVFESDCALRCALGEAFSTYYIRVKREEWRTFNQHVSQWERDHFLKTF